MTLNQSDFTLRLLLIGHLDRLRSRLDRNQYYRYEALARLPGVTLFGPGEPGYRPQMTIKEAVSIACNGVWPDIVLHGMDFKESGVPLVRGLTDCPVITALELQDSWAVPERQMAFINAQRFDFGLVIVGHHIPLYRRHCPRTQFLWTPNAVNTLLFRNYGLPKTTDVLVYGNLAEHTYPLRARLANLLSQQRDLRVRVIPHPGYYPPHGPETVGVVAGEQLSREINRSWIAISTSSIYRCVMMKYFEIAASRSLIAGDMPEEGKLTFGRNFLELHLEQSDEQLLDAIRSTLADRNRLMSMTDAAHVQVIRHHSTDAFAARLLEMFRGIVRDRLAQEYGTQAFLVGSD